MASGTQDLEMFVRDAGGMLCERRCRKP